PRSLFSLHRSKQVEQTVSVISAVVTHPYPLGIRLVGIDSLSSGSQAVQDLGVSLFREGSQQEPDRAGNRRASSRSSATCPLTIAAWHKCVRLVAERAEIDRRPEIRY